MIPDVGGFKAPRIDNSVLFPEPDCPITLTDSPFSISSVTDFRASTSSPIDLYTFFISLNEIIISDILLPPSISL